MASTDSLIVGEGPYRGDQLPALNAALDDPIERSAAGDLGATCRDHPGSMILLDRLSGAPTLIEPEGTTIQRGTAKLPALGCP